MKHTDVPVEEKLSNIQTRSAVNAPLIITGSLFGLVLALSAFLFFQNQSLSSDIKKTNAEIATYDGSIAKLKGDRNIAAAELLGNTENKIRQDIRISEAQRYTSEIGTIAKKYKINLVGFNYQGGKISTAATASSDAANPSVDAIAKVTKFIRDYRNTNNSIFRLSPVTSVAGQEQQRAFSIEFEVNGTITR